MSSSSRIENCRKSAPLARYWRRNRLVFSFDPRCHGPICPSAGASPAGGPANGGWRRRSCGISSPANPVWSRRRGARVSATTRSTQATSPLRAVPARAAAARHTRQALTAGLRHAWPDLRAPPSGWCVTITRSACSAHRIATASTAHLLARVNATRTTESILPGCCGHPLRPPTFHLG